MAKDYYNILGVEKNASQDEVKRAFHKLAHQYHPDKKGGDEAKFKEVNEAYQVLGNTEKRQQYDQYGRTFNGAGSGGQQGGFGGFEGFDFSQFQRGGQGGFQFDFGGGDFDDILRGFGFGGMRRGRDFQTEIKISFLESVTGAERKVFLPEIQNGKEIKKEVVIKIPAGVENGQTLELAGHGEKIQNGHPGNLYIQIEVEKHPRFEKQGMHIITDLKVKLSDAIEGGKYEIEMYDNSKLSIKIPEGLASGQILRVKGKGVNLGTFRKGDLLIRTRIEIPTKLSKKAKEAVEILRKEGL